MSWPHVRQQFEIEAKQPVLIPDRSPDHVCHDMTGQFVRNPGPMMNANGGKFRRQLICQSER